MSANHLHPETADGEAYHSSQEQITHSDNDSFQSANDEGVGEEDEEEDDELDLDFEDRNVDVDDEDEDDDEDDEEEDEDEDEEALFHGQYLKCGGISPWTLLTDITDANGDPIEFQVVVDQGALTGAGGGGDGTTVEVRIGGELSPLCLPRRTRH